MLAGFRILAYSNISSEEYKSANFIFINVDHHMERFIQSH